MSRTVRVKAPARVNLALRIHRRRADGLQDVHTISQAVSLYDDVRASEAPAGEFRLSFTGEGAAFLPIDGTNLAIRAARTLAQHQQAQSGVSLRIKKRIPVAGGLGGGAADAAGTLVACNELWHTGLSREQLIELAEEVDPDVGFYLRGGTARGGVEGVAAHLEAEAKYHWTFALFRRGLSSASVYREFERLGAAGGKLDARLTAALTHPDVGRAAKAIVNDLTPAVESLEPALVPAREAGMAAGAAGAVVCGTGPTLGFLTQSCEAAKQVAAALEPCHGVRRTRHAKGPVSGARIVED